MQSQVFDEAGDDADDDESVPDASPDNFELFTATSESDLSRFRDRMAVIALAWRMLWRAARWRGVLVVFAEGAASLGVGGQLLVGNGLLTSALEARAAGTSLNTVVPDAVVFGALTAVLAGLRIASQAQQPVLQDLISTHASTEIQRAAAAAPLVAFEEPEFFNRLQRAVMQGQFRPFVLAQSLTIIIAAVLGSAGIALALLAIQPVLVLFAVLAAVPTWLVTKRNAMGQFVLNVGTTPEERERAYLSWLGTDRYPAKELRALGVDEHLRARYARVSERVLSRKRDEAGRHLRRSLVGSVISGAATALGGVALLWLFVADNLTVAAAFTAALALQQLRGRMAMIAVSAGAVYESALFLEDYASFVDVSAADDAQRLAARRKTAEPFRALRAEGVSFTYPGAPAPAVDNVDLDLHAGEVVALVGENGSGKTTLAKLLCTLFEPTEGRITWDGCDLREYEPAALRNHITVIFQDFVRYALSARDNVGLGRHERLDDDAAIDAAIETAGLSKAFARLPEGADTVLGKQFAGGQDLSGGQWQRVALARAFFRDASFLVLDEPTASLDARAEHRLFARLRRLTAGRTVLLITHRFANVRMADRIYVLDKGRVVESGNHEELMRLDGRYAELFLLQASQFGVGS